MKAETMKNFGKAFLSLIVILVAQVLSLGLFYMGTEVDLKAEYQRGVLHNFELISALIEDNFDNLDALDLSKEYTYNFTNLFVVETDGYIAFALKTSGGLLKGTRYESDGVTFSQMMSGDKTFGEGRVEGTGALIVSRRVGDLLIVGYESLTLTNEFLFKQVQKLILAGGLQFLIAAVIVLLLCRKRGEKEVVFQPSGDGYFIVHINKQGKVIDKKNDAFKEKFDVENIVDHVLDNENTIAKILSEKLPFSILLADKEGQQRHFDCLATSKSYGYRVLALDSTKQYFESKRVSERIFHEPLTGLKNKGALELDFDRCLNKNTRDQCSLVIFNIKNLDNLKTLFSQSVKTELIKKCANLFKDKYAKINEIYYFDDNKFAILTLNTVVTEEIKQSINEFNSNLNAIMRIDHNDVQIITDVVFLYLDNKSRNFKLSEALEYNEYLMLNIKNRVKSNVIAEIFTASKYYHAIGNKKEITKKIIDENNFSLFYQPQFSLKDGKLASFEALVRLNELTLSTQDFILISEVNGYMLQLGEQILKKAFNFARTIRTTGLIISINLSPIQLLNKGFVDNFLKQYKEYQLNDNSIALEITETFLMSDIEENIQKLQILHDNKICIHLDDFGMGYSSLSYLKNLPVDTIKIDREFVGEVSSDKYSKSICNFIILTAKQLGMTTIAEGVERQEQLNSLKDIGCDFIQGYLTGKAMSEEDTIQFIEKNRKSDSLATHTKN